MHWVSIGKMQDGTFYQEVYTYQTFTYQYAIYCSFPISEEKSRAACTFQDRAVAYDSKPPLWSKDLRVT